MILDQRTKHDRRLELTLNKSGPYRLPRLN